MRFVGKEHIMAKCKLLIDKRKSDVIVLRNRIGMYDSPYSNSGVLLVNLDYWREHDVARRLAAFVREHPEKCLLSDQDALNVRLHGAEVPPVWI